jgi:hypothetical protein
LLCPWLSFIAIAEFDPHRQVAVQAWAEHGDAGRIRPAASQGRQHVHENSPYGALLWAESNGFVAVANEEVAIRAALPGGYKVQEAQVKEIRVWER